MTLNRTRRQALLGSTAMASISCSLAGVYSLLAKLGLEQLTLGDRPRRIVKP
jgi:hypothetical protein